MMFQFLMDWMLEQFFFISFSYTNFAAGCGGIFINTAAIHLIGILDNDNPTWSSYFNLFSEKLLDIDTQDYHIASFAQFLHIGLSIMMSGGKDIMNGAVHSSVDKDKQVQGVDQSTLLIL